MRIVDDMTQVAQALSLIKSRKKRITKARKSVIDTIYNYAKPVSAPEILKKLHKSGLKVNKTTIYRELNFLLGQNLVREVKISPYIIHYESANLGHHHHLICDNCGSVEEIVCDELEVPMVKLQKRVSHNFSIKKHNLEFYGTCAGCV